MNDPKGSAEPFARVRRPAGSLALGRGKPLVQRIRAILNTPVCTDAERLLEQAIDAWSAEAPKLAEWSEDSLPAGFSVFVCRWRNAPPAHHQRFRTHQYRDQAPSRVAPIFPNAGPYLRFVSARLAACEEDWMIGKNKSRWKDCLHHANEIVCEQFLMGRCTANARAIQFHL